MLELLAPAGSPEAVAAAVQAGADAVYLGFGDFNARRNAKNFTLEELTQAVSDLAAFLISGTIMVHYFLREFGKERV